MQVLRRSDLRWRHARWPVEACAVGVERLLVVVKVVAVQSCTGWMGSSRRAPSAAAKGIAALAKWVRGATSRGAPAARGAPWATARNSPVVPETARRSLGAARAQPRTGIAGCGSAHRPAARRARNRSHRRRRRSGQNEEAPGREPARDVHVTGKGWAVPGGGHCAHQRNGEGRGADAPARRGQWR
jgi:hypothetical protein